MKSYRPLNMVVFIFAMILCATFLLIPLVCLWGILDDLSSGNVFMATLKLMVSVVTAITGIFLAIIITRCLRQQ